MRKAGNSQKISLVVWIGLFVGLVAFFWIASSHVSEIVDDAFISFRYAKNLAEGKGLVFNAGERVEGYTNVLWVLIMAAAYKAGFGLPRVAHFLSILCAAALVVAVARFSKSYFRDQPHPTISYFAPALLALNPLFLEQIGTGMETLLFALLMFLGFTARISARNNTKQNYLAGFLPGLGYLTRPEAVIWIFGFIVVDTGRMILKKDESSNNLAQIAKYCSIFAVIAACHLAWRFSYYGAWLPNTYYAKGAANWSWGVFYTSIFLISSGLLPLVALTAGPVLIRKQWVAYASVISILTLIYNARVGGDFIFTGRFLFPLLPLIYLLVQELFRMASVAVADAANQPRKKKLLRGFQTAILILFLLGSLNELAIARFGVRFHRDLNDLDMRLAECIQENTARDDTIALLAAGVVPYYCNRHIIDMMGLTDRHIARFGIIDKKCTIAHQKADSDYVLDREPEIILLAPPDPELREMTYPLRLNIAANNEMHNNPRLLQEYEEVSWDCDVYPTLIYERRR